MKNKADLQQELDEILKTLSSSSLLSELKPAQISKLIKRKDGLKLMLRYLDYAPTPEFLEKEISRLENKITLLFNQFDLQHPNRDEIAKPELSKMKKAFEVLHDIPRLREQVRTIRYLL